LSTLPTQSERKKLEELSNAGHFHFKLLLVLVACGGGTYFLPEDLVMPAAVVLLILFFLTFVSHINLQHFQRCPRCNTTMSRIQAACASCGLEYYASESSKRREGWHD